MGCSLVKLPSRQGERRQHKQKQEDKSLAQTQRT